MRLEHVTRLQCEQKLALGTRPAAMHDYSKPDQRKRSAYYKDHGKRAFDLIITIPLFIVSSPLLLLITLCCRVFMGKPVLFRQLRPGYGKTLFTIYKFRTMLEAADARGLPLPDQERLHPFGTFLRRTSLDELPELWNVILGEMSLVGPRPLLPEYLPRYNVFERRRHEVRPGITGLAQISGRNQLTWPEKFKLDVHYVDHVDVKLDLRILLVTLISVIARKGINQAGHATAAPFLGSGTGASN
jgi:lipopolysaccharide/colanic/teichoic acid biosynthesis glycosyltransferase